MKKKFAVLFLVVASLIENEASSVGSLRERFSNAGLNNVSGKSSAQYGSTYEKVLEKEFEELEKKLEERTVNSKEQVELENFFDWLISTKTYQDSYQTMLWTLKNIAKDIPSNLDHKSTMQKLAVADEIIPKEIYVMGEILAPTNKLVQAIASDEKKTAKKFTYENSVRLASDSSQVQRSSYTNHRIILYNIFNDKKEPDRKPLLNRSIKSNEGSSPIIISKYRTTTNTSIFSIMDVYKLKRKKDKAIGVIGNASSSGFKRTNIRKFQVAVSNAIYYSIALMMSNSSSDQIERTSSDFLKSLEGTPNEVANLFLSKVKKVQSAEFLASDLSIEEVDVGFAIWLVKLKMNLLFLSKSNGSLITTLCSNSTKKESIKCKELKKNGENIHRYSTQIARLNVKDLPLDMTIRESRDTSIDRDKAKQDVSALKDTLDKASRAGTEISIDDKPKKKLIDMLENTEKTEKVMNILVKDAEEMKKINILPWWRDSSNPESSEVRDKDKGPKDLYLDHYYNLCTNENNLYWFYKDRTFTVDINMGLLLYTTQNNAEIFTKDKLKNSAQKSSDILRDLQMHKNSIDTVEIVSGSGELEIGYNTLPEYVKIDYLIDFFLLNGSQVSKIIISNVCLDYFPRSLLSINNRQVTHLKFNNVIYMGSLLSSIMDYTRSKLAQKAEDVPSEVDLRSEEFIRKYIQGIYDTADSQIKKAHTNSDAINVDTVVTKIMDRFRSASSSGSKAKEIKLKINTVNTNEYVEKYIKRIFGENEKSGPVHSFTAKYKDMLGLKEVLESVDEFKIYAAIFNHLTPEALYEDIVANNLSLKNLCVSESVIPYSQKKYNTEERLVTESLAGLMETDKPFKTELEQIVIKGRIMESVDFLSKLDSTKIYSIHFVILDVHDLYAVRYITSINRMEDISFAGAFLNRLEKMEQKNKNGSDMGSNNVGLKEITTLLEQIKNSSLKKSMDRELQLGFTEVSYTENVLINIKKTKLRALEKKVKVIGISLTKIDLDSIHHLSEKARDNIRLLDVIGSPETKTALKDSIYSSSFPVYHKSLLGKKRDLEDTLLSYIIDSEIAGLLEYLKNHHSCITASYNIVKCIYLDNVELILKSSFCILDSTGFPGVSCRIFSSGLNTGILRLNVYNSTETVVDPEIEENEHPLYFEAAIGIFSLQNGNTSIGKFANQSNPGNSAIISPTNQNSILEPRASTALECRLITPITMVIVTFVSNVAGIGAAILDNNEKMKNGRISQSKYIKQFRELWMDNPPLILGVVPYSLIPYFSISGYTVKNEAGFLLSCGFTQIVMPEPGRYKKIVESCCFKDLCKIGYNCLTTMKQIVYIESPNFVYEEDLQNTSPNISKCKKTHCVVNLNEKKEKELHFWNILLSSEYFNDIIHYTPSDQMYAEIADLQKIKEDADRDTQTMKDVAKQLNTAIYMHRILMCISSEETAKKVEKIYPALSVIHKNRKSPALQDTHSQGSSISRNTNNSIIKIKETEYSDLSAIYHMDFLLCTPCIFDLVQNDCNVRSNKKERENIIGKRLRIVESEMEQEEKQAGAEKSSICRNLTRKTYYRVLKFMEDERSSQILIKSQYTMSLAYKFLTMKDISELDNKAPMPNKKVELVRESSSSLHSDLEYKALRERMNRYMKNVMDAHHNSMDELHTTLLKYLTNSTYPIFYIYEEPKKESSNANRERYNSNVNNGADFLDYKMPLVPPSYIDMCFDEYAKKGLESINIKIVEKDARKKSQKADTKECSFMGPLQKDIEMFSLISDLTIAEIEAILLFATNFKEVYDTFYNREMYTAHTSIDSTSIQLDKKINYLLIAKTPSASVLNYKSAVLKNNGNNEPISLFLKYGEFTHAIGNRSLLPEQKYFSFNVAFLKTEL
ncbi:hypothetical protein NEMIN01_1501 [Nematocida minor]|uniref:uncharacterized protein n=1 Tax=Nematocida minor TaxID=1912983 RepID=UPI00221E8D87|nr:uncharacterized protein NEMIN01_1501 [Nematocida minor]KAI5191425.1 hypothetical protein NEMIN01_1501 [Nematocida minor]